MAVTDSRDGWALARESFGGINGKAVAQAATPFVLALSFVALSLHPAWRPYASELLGEDGPLEILTFLALFCGGWIGVALVRRAQREAQGGFVVMFFGLIAAGMLLTAMEEISWGQWIFGFDPPAVWKNVNAQEELNLHNLGPWQGKNSILRLVFGYGGLFGLWFASGPLGRVAPPRALAPWFLTIAFFASVEAYYDFVRWTPGILTETLQEDMPELIEMMVGFVGLAYVWIHWKRLSKRGSGGEAITPME